MASINQLNLLSLTRNGQNRKTVSSPSNYNFKQAFQSAIKAPESLDEMFSEASRTYGVSENLLKAVAKAESNFNPSATSKKGAAGIMQLMPATARSLGVKDPYDARSNIMGGAKYLKENLQRYDGNVELALAAYNAGSNNVSKYGGIPPFKETQEYVKKVMGYMGEPMTAGFTAPTYASSGREKESYANSLSSALGSGYSTGSLDASGLLSVLETMSDQSTKGMSETALSANKSDFLYLIELMKLRMQMASSGLSDSFGSESDLL